MKLLRYTIYIALLLVACASPAAAPEAAPQLPSATAAAAAPIPDYVTSASQEICDAFAEYLTSNPNTKFAERCTSFTVSPGFLTSSRNDGYFLLAHYLQGDMGFVIYFFNGELVAMFPG